MVFVYRKVTVCVYINFIASHLARKTEQTALRIYRTGLSDFFVSVVVIL